MGLVVVVRVVAIDFAWGSERRRCFQNIACVSIVRYTPPAMSSGSTLIFDARVDVGAVATGKGVEHFCPGRVWSLVNGCFVVILLYELQSVGQHKTP